jgi:hypothetical protein
MQDVLTFAIEAVTVGFGAFMVADFALRFAVRKPRPVAAAAPTAQPVAVAESVAAPAFVPNLDGFPVATVEEAALVEAHAAFVARFWSIPAITVELLPDPWEIEIEPIATVLPLFTNPPRLLLLPAAKTQDWSKLTPEQLRKECQARQIKWRNAHGKNKHLKKNEMIALLSA